MNMSNRRKIRVNDPDPINMSVDETIVREYFDFRDKVLKILRGYLSDKHIEAVSKKFRIPVGRLVRVRRGDGMMTMEYIVETLTKIGGKDIKLLRNIGRDRRDKEINEKYGKADENNTLLNVFKKEISGD